MWDGVVANFNYNDETEYFREWSTAEIRCNAMSTEPGFHEWNSTGRLPGITPGAEDGVMYPVRWTSYRAEDGTLLVVHCCFVDPQGVTKPIIFFTHPEHQRKGHGKRMYEYLKERYIRENGKINPSESWADARVTTPGVGFMDYCAKDATEYNKNTPD